MNCLFARIAAVACALAGWASPAAAQQWRMQYLYDEGKSVLDVQDVAFSSPMRGVAVGRIEERGHERGVSLTTSDGGVNWRLSPLEDEPVSLFLLNDSLGWMVTEKGLWRTAEGGKGWVKLPKVPAPALRVFFVDERRGWAACGNKTVLATVDGGAHWVKVQEASRQPGTTAGTVYGWIAFATPQVGIITGWDIPLHRDERYPDWLDPQRVVTRRETPHMTLTLETHDGGETWKSTSASAFGEITRVRFGAPGYGLGIVTHSASFEYPSEVYRIPWPNGKAEPAYRDKDFCATDAWLGPDGTAYLAGTVAFSKLRAYVPQKVKVLKTRNFTDWTPMPVDYRAVAKRVTLAGAGGDLWLATDNGMILKLAP
ncbi:MAG: hypothetical protein ABSF25_03055 [Bryobacteraceae bacterium]